MKEKLTINQWAEEDRPREKMLEKGILIRDASNFKYLDERFIRLAIKDRENNDFVIKKLKEVLDIGERDGKENYR